MSSSQRTSARVSAAFYAVLALVLVGALAAGTSLASTKIPPGIAGLPSQGTDHLRGGASLDGEAEDAQEKRVFKASVLQCHTWPDGTITQTSDPRSPFCVSGWDEKRGNGGSTSPGVEGNVVRIGVPSVNVDTQALESYFNSRYEFYGRSIKLVPIGPIRTAALQRAAIAEAAARNVFAVAPVSVSTAAFQPFDADSLLKGLAAEKIIGVAIEGVRSDATLMNNGPYAWSLNPTEEQQQRYQARFVCSSLKGRPARFSADFTSQERTFAVLTPARDSLSQGARVVDPSLLVRSLAQCGIKARAVEYAALDFGQADTDRDVAMFRQLKAEGVTTLIGAGGDQPVITLVTVNAETADYHPEFVMTATGSSDWSYGTKSQEHAMIGLLFGAPPSAAQAPPAVQAFVESGYTLRQAQNARTEGGGDLFASLGVIAAGIQAAGPDLTPQSFAAGLEATKFPSPSNTPTWGFGALGFQLGDHTFVRDAGLTYWDPDHYPSWSPPKDRNAQGRMCLTRDGQRFSLDSEFPTDDAGFYDTSLDCDAPGSAGDDQPPPTFTPPTLSTPTPDSSPDASSDVSSDARPTTPAPEAAPGLPAPTSTLDHTHPRGAR